MSLQGSSSARPTVNMIILQACAKMKVSFKSRTPKAHQLQVRVVYMQGDFICGQSSDLTLSDEPFCLQANSKVPTPHHLITNLVYSLKPHHKRNQYLRARLDTCTDVNIMSLSGPGS